MTKTGNAATHPIRLEGIGATTENKVSNCIIRGIDGASYDGRIYGIMVNDANMTAKIWNCLIYGFISNTAAYGRGIYELSSSTLDVFNCTVTKCGQGIRSDSATVKNCASFNNTDDFVSSPTVIDYCASDDGDDTGSNAEDFTADALDWNKVFTNYTTDDYSLLDYTTSPCCVNQGTDNPGSGLYSDDIIGTARTSSWDIGAFEYTSGVTLEQEGYRFRNDDGSESAATWRQTQDTVDTVAKSTNIRLRVLINATGDPATKQYQLEYKEASDGAAEWRKVPLT
jgi:hypothetical protein